MQFCRKEDTHQFVCLPDTTGFPTGVENMRGLYLEGSSKFDGRLKSIQGGRGGGGLKMLLKNICKLANLLKMNFFTHIFHRF